MNNGLLYLITVLIWGSTWLAIEFQLGVVAPEVSIVYRYVVSALLLFVWCWLRGVSLKYGVRDHLTFALLGLLMFGLNYVLAYRAQIFITSALASITFSSMVWMNIVLARIFLGVRAGWPILLGSVFGIVGIIVLFAPLVGELSFGDKILLGCAFAFLGALSASLGNIVSQGAQIRGLPVVQANTWGMFYGAVWTGGLALVSGHDFNFELTVDYVSSLVYLSVFGSVIAFWAYLTLLGRIGAHRAGYAAVMFPVVALILSILFEGLKVDLSVVAGTTLVLAGNLFVLRTRHAKA